MRFALLLLLGLLASHAAHSAHTAQSAPGAVPASPCGPEGRPIPIPQDTLLHVDNRGVVRIFATISGHRFKLVTDPAEVGQSANAFLIPRRGAISINIAALINPDGENCYAFSLQGPPEAGAQFFIANTPLTGQEIAYAIGVPESIPEAFDLLRSYPNPFREHATIVYHIPARRTTGLPVELAVFDLLGRRVRTLVDARRFPGAFEVRWDGTNDYGVPVPSGMYLCRLIAGEMQQTIKMVRVQ